MSINIIIPVFEDALLFKLLDSLYTASNSEKNVQFYLVKDYSDSPTVTTKIRNLTQFSTFVSTSLAELPKNLEIHSIVYALNPVRVQSERNKSILEMYEQTISACLKKFSSSGKVRHVFLSDASVDSTLAPNYSRLYQLENTLINSLVSFTIIRSHLLYGFSNDVNSFLKLTHDFSVFYPRSLQKINHLHPVSLDSLIPTLADTLFNQDHKDRIIRLEGSISYPIKDVFNSYSKTNTSFMSKISGVKVPKVLEKNHLGRLNSYLNGYIWAKDYLEYLEHYLPLTSTLESIEVDNRSFKNIP